jgi:hypothetical protein
MRRLIREGKAELELAVTKCLTGAKLTPVELTEVCAVGESDLMRDYGCDLYMAETVKLHAKKEMLRLRAQNQFTKMDGLWNDNGYPTKPYTRTEYIKESRRRLREDHHEEDRHSDQPGRMMDYGHTKSDSEEGRMAKKALRDIAVNAYRLHQMLEDGDDLPQWCQYKMAQAEMMMSTVRDYLEYKLERMGEDPVGEAEMFDQEEMEEDFGEQASQMQYGPEEYEYEEYDEDEYEEDDEDEYEEDDEDEYEEYDEDEYDEDEYDEDEYDEDEQVKSDDSSAEPEMPHDVEDIEDDEGYDGAEVKISLEKDEDA